MLALLRLPFFGFRKWGPAAPCRQGQALMLRAENETPCSRSAPARAMFRFPALTANPAHRRLSSRRDLQSPCLFQSHEAAGGFPPNQLLSPRRRVQRTSNRRWLTQSGSVDGYVWQVVCEVEPDLTSKARVLHRSELLGFPSIAAGKQIRFNQGTRPATAQFAGGVGH